MKEKITKTHIELLAEFIVSFKNRGIDELTLNHAALTVADTYATAFSGINTKAFKTAFKSAENLFGKGDLEIWGSNKTSSLLGSVFYNTLAISSTDFDEGHRKAVGHPASAVLATALILSKDLNIGLKDILKSVIIGYEIALRFSMARNPKKINSYSSGRWAAFGTAATASYLLNSNVGQTVQALSNASVLSPHMLGGSTDVSTGSMSKEGVAWAVQSGLQSSVFAKDGFSGPYLFLEDHDDYNNELLIGNFGKSYFISSNYFKPFACCRWLHPALQACAEIMQSNKFEISDIKIIKAFTFRRIKNLISNNYPANVVMSQFHLPYVIAIMLLYNECGPAYFADNHLHKREIKEIIDKVEIIVDEVYTNKFPDALSSRIEIETSNAVYVKEVLVAPWEFGFHPSKEQLKQKFDLQTANYEHIPWDWFFQY